MKIKNLTVISTFISCIFFSCSTPVNNINKSVISTSRPTTTPTQTALPLPYKAGIIKNFIDSSALKNRYNIIFNDYSTVNNLAVDSGHLYYAANGYLTSFNLSSLNIDIDPRNCNSNKEKVIQNISKFQSFFPLAAFCSDSRNFKIIQGKNNIFYLYNLSKIIKVDGNKVEEIFDGSYGNSSIDEITVADNLNIYLTNYNSIRKINNKKQIEWIRNKDNTTGDDFYSSVSIQVDKDNNLYFLDLKDLRVKKMTPEGVVSTIIGKGNSRELDIAGIEYKISDPEIKLAIDNDDNLYLVEKNKNRVLKYDKNTNRLSLYAGGGTVDFSDNRLANQSRLNKPAAITFDKDNNAYILDLGNKSIKKIGFKTNIMSIFIGEPTDRGDGNDISKVSFKNMTSIYSKNNDLYISEEDRIRKIKDYRITTTIAGNGTTRPSSPPIFNSGAQNTNNASITRANILFIDNENNIYISENNVVKKITDDNRIMSLQAELWADSVAQDSKGNLYFSSTTIKKIDKNNNIENFAGKYEQETLLNSGSIPPPPSPEDAKRDALKDGDKVTEILYFDARSIVIDSKDNLYCIARYNYNLYSDNVRENALSIVRISPDGVIKVLNGNNKDLINPRKLIIDKEDNLYFIDSRYGNTNDTVHYDLIKKIDTSGNVSIYAGKVATNFVQTDIDNNKAADAIFRDIFISDITIDDNGFLYFLTNENKIYRIE